MKRLRNLFWIVNKLSHKGRLTAESIAEHCDVSKRTAYRYIGTLSEAGVPLYFDYRSGTYCLDPEFRGFAESMNIVDALLCVVALLDLADRLDENYRGHIMELINRIEMRFPLALIDNQLRGDGAPLRSLRDGNFRENLNLLILQAAIKFNRPVVIRSADNGTEKEVKLSHPRLTLKDGWLVGSRSSDNDLFPVKDVTIVSVCKGG
jgi:predicted DNA-binding transcriptional regulator YafY